MPFFEDAPLVGRQDTLSLPDRIPVTRGVYAWFFREPPPTVPLDGCFRRDGKTLLYVWISPKNSQSRQHLRKRITYHYRGNAEGSTLRLTLGALLAPYSDFPLRRVGSGRRMTFTHLGEQWLDAWMDRNALVCWIEHPEPWMPERELFQSKNLPLNVEGTRHRPFSATPTAIGQHVQVAARATAAS